MPDQEMTAFLYGVVGVVDANSFETMCLWNDYTDRHGKGTWEESISGLSEIVGNISDMPVCVSLNVATVCGNRLLFVDPTSQVVDHRLIDEWLKTNLPITAFRDNDPRKGVNRANAMNFHNVLRRKPEKASAGIAK